MRLHVEKVKVAMDKAEMTEEMLIVKCDLRACGAHPINGDHTISPMRVRKIARVLGVDAKEIIVEDYEGEAEYEFK